MLTAWPRKILFWAIGLIAGLSLGFLCANIFISDLATSKPQPASAPEPTLSLAEIKTAVATADARPEDLALQRKLGLGLYQYSRLTPDALYLPEIARLLQRAQKPADREVTFALGNTLLAMAQTGARQHSTEARKYYAQLLAQQPQDADTQTALGLTYFYESPPQTLRAISEIRQALKFAPQHQGALQALATILISQGRFTEANNMITKLSATNPQHPALPALRKQLAQAANAKSL